MKLKISRQTLKKHAKRGLVAVVAGFLLFLAFDLLFPLPPAKPMSKLVLDRDGKLLSAFLSDDEQWRMPTKADELNPDLVKALIAKEDRWFYWHYGVNPIAIGRAAFSNLFAGRRVSGASTITMQVARMLERKERTFWSKMKEMFRAVQLEWHFSKDEILEMYLSYLPYGGNVEGVKAASYIYFDKPPATLSLSQATLLTVIPNRPNSLRMDLFPDAAKSARDQWLRKFDEDGVFPSNQVRAALEEPVQAKRHEVESKAPHLSRRLISSRQQVVIRSTIDSKTQQLAENLLAEYVSRVRHKGISNGAVLVVDNLTASVIAYCGSADFQDQIAHGQVDGIQAVRSPGSTLKPLAYALAMDNGRLTPDSRMLDIPTDWNGYSPDNYDETFRGPVSMTYALRHSLNIPAVEALRQGNFNTFLNRLQDIGFRTVKRQRKDLGLSVVLGGCGTTLEELTGLFSAFACGGLHRGFAFTSDDLDQRRAVIPVVSPSAAWLITDILSGIERPDLPKDLLTSSGRAPVAWKTGTSYGRRDAWSIGYTKRYTIGVWIGNFDGRGAMDLSGTTMAVPLLFDLFNAMEAGKPKIPDYRPFPVYQREICAETGDIPGPDCGRKRQGYYIRSASSRKVCDQERMLYVSADSSLQFCTGCLPESGFVRASYSVLPAPLTLWYENTGTQYRKPPPHNPACTATFDGPGPQILSPTVGYEYLLEEGANQEILLQAASDGRVARHYWYVNGTFFRSCNPGERIFYSPKRGKMTVMCMDDRGRQAKAEVVVKTY